MWRKYYQCSPQLSIRIFVLLCVAVVSLLGGSDSAIKAQVCRKLRLLFKSALWITVPLFHLETRRSGPHPPCSVLGFSSEESKATMSHRAVNQHLGTRAGQGTVLQTAKTDANHGTDMGKGRCAYLLGSLPAPQPCCSASISPRS